MGGTHVYAAPGVYEVVLTVADDDGGVGAAMLQYVAVFDPSGGFVTGGGWIESPAGAYALDPALEGRATFGFVSKYLRGALVPSGQTEFQFRAGALNFHSEAHQWLVVAGAKAQFKGTGTIDGAAGYGFLLTATDGKIAGGGGVDRFRMKIWRAADGALIYDNVPTAADGMEGANPQVLGAGSIVIHGG